MRRLMTTAIVAGVLLGWGSSTTAAPVAGTCAMKEVFNYELFALNRPLPGPNPMGIAAKVTIDPDTGVFTFDGGSMVFPPYPFPFADLFNDTFTFGNTVFTGHIDAAGNVDLAAVRYQFCTLDSHPDPAAIGCLPAGTCDCVPGNVCSNDTSDPCVVGATSPCAGGGACQGACANDPAKSCAGDGDCPGSRCGKGGLTPFSNDMTSGISAKDSILVRGAALDFATGTLRIGTVGSTPEEAPVVGSSGTSGFFVACTLDPKPDAASLPPSRWTAGKSQAKLGKQGPGKTDDTLVFAGTVDPIEAGVQAEGLVVTLAQEDTTLPSPELRAKLVLALTIPPGALAAKGKKLTLKDKDGSVVTTLPPSKAKHMVVLRREKSGGFKLKLVSKGLDLDAIGDQPVLLTNVRVGTESGAAVQPVTKRKTTKLFF